MRALYTRGSQFIVDRNSPAPPTIDSASQDEFSVPYRKMRPELSNADFEDIWRDIDVDNSGTLSLGELEAFYGFNDGMSDDQIMEMLMVSARPRDPCD